MEKIDFIKINEECEKYLAENQNNFYIKHLPIYLEKAKSLLECTPLEMTQPEETYVDLLEGIEMIYEYLKELKQELAEKFITMLTNGEIEINYTDEDIWLEEKNERSEYHNYNHSHRKIKQINENEIVVHTSPLSLIDIDNKKTTYSRLTTIVHEFFHSITAQDKNKMDTTDFTLAVTEMIAIYFEQDFINWMNKKGYDKNIFLSAYTERYNDTTNKNELSFFLDQTIMLYKKITEGVLDKDSYKLGKVKIDKDYYIDLGNRATKFLEYWKEEKPLFSSHKTAPYIIGAPLAYHLSSNSDPRMPQKMIAFTEEINSISLTSSLAKIDLSQTKIKSLNDTNIMENMRNEIIEISKNVKNDKEKSFVKA